MTDTWLTGTTPAPHPSGITVHGGSFYAVTNDLYSEAFLWKSDNGVSWTTTPLHPEGETSGLQRGGIISNGNILCAYTDYLSTALTAVSMDGIAWTYTDTTITLNYSGAIASKGSQICIIGLDNSYVSTNGTSWTEGTGSPFTIFNIVNKNSFVSSPTNYSALFWYYNAGEGIMNVKAAVSTNGLTWTVGNFVTNDLEWGAMAYGSSTFVAIALDTIYSPSGAPTQMAASSTDGLSWTLRDLPPIATDGSDKWGTVTFCNGRFVLISANKAKIRVSTDGHTWTEAADFSYAGSYGYWSLAASSATTAVFVTVIYNSLSAAVGPASLPIAFWTRLHGTTQTFS